jgi:hypothetical protein
VGWSLEGCDANLVGKAGGTEEESSAPPQEGFGAALIGDGPLPTFEQQGPPLPLTHLDRGD